MALNATDDNAPARATHRVAASPGADLEAPFLGARLHQASQRYAAELDKALGGGITRAQFQVMDALSRHAPCSQTVLVNATGVDRSTLADIVRRLKGRGLIERKRNKDDTRAYLAKLTPAGTAALREARKAVEKLDRTIGKEIVDSLQRG